MNKKIIIVVVAALAVFIVGYWLGSRGGTQSAQDQSTAGAAERAIKFWTCSMHPQIRQPGPGQCPLCGMDLVPVTDSQTEGDLMGPRELSLSPAAMKLAEVQTAPVERQFVTKLVRMVGKVEYDETRLAYITAWIPGRLDRLYVDYTGLPVTKGDHMVELYSPELLQAQEALLQAHQTVEEMADSDSLLSRELAEKRIVSGREKLRLWGLSESQIKEIEQRRLPSDHLTINAPASGIVIHKNALEGMYVKEGTQIYTIADLSQLWVRLDAYESDLPWIHYGQEIEFETEAYPGEVFSGRISFIDPVLNPHTRTVKVRVNVANPDGRLKPEMFVRAVVRSRIAAEGKVFDPTLAGKWICPMHPEIVKDAAGSCDVCGMETVPAESMGYVSVDTVTTNAPLTIPWSAPLITGTRAVVYVAIPGKEGHFEGREIVLGPRAGDYYLVRDGLAEGELVVVNGNFKIDSAIQILAKPSMMSPEGGGPAPGHQHGGDGHGAPTRRVNHEESDSANAVTRMEAPAEFQAELAELMAPYSRITEAMRSDSASELSGAVGDALSMLDSVDMTLVTGEAHMQWMEQAQAMKQALQAMEGKEVKAARPDYAGLSQSLAEAFKTFGISGDDTLYVLKCPMALDGKGAIWLQTDEETKNPYFGGGMLSCGSVIETVRQP